MSRLNVRVKVLSIVHVSPPFEKRQQFDTNEILAANPNLASQLRLRQLDNDTLFGIYFNELKLRNLSSYYIKKVWELDKAVD